MMKIRTATHKYIIEKEYNGFRCMAHKNLKGVKLFSAQKDVFELAFLTPLIAELSNREFLIDGVLVAYHGKDPLGETAMTSIIESGHVPPSIEVKFHVFDMVYYDGVDISDFPLHKRKALLNHLRFNSSIKNVYSLIVTSKEDLEKSAKLFCSMTGSNGAIIKEYGTTYTMSEWLRYSKIQRLKTTILKCHELAGSYYYEVGIPVRDVYHSLRPNYLSVIGKETYLEIGKTQPTKVMGKRGDVIELEVEGVLKHEWYSDGELRNIRYSIHNPTVLAVEADGTASSIDHLKKLSESQGNKVIENMDLILEETNPDSEGGTISRLALEFWEDNWHKMYPVNGLGKFTFQHHWQALSEEDKDLEHTELLGTKNLVHGDLRFSATQDAWAFTILEGSACDIPKEEGSNLITISNSRRKRLQVHPKCRLPMEWLNMGKDEPSIISPGQDGATDKWAKIFALDWGSYTAGTWTDNMIELFMHGKKINGRMLIREVRIGDAQRWLVSFPEDQQPFAATHSKEQAMHDMCAAGLNHLIWNNPNNSKAPEFIDLR